MKPLPSVPLTYEDMVIWQRLCEVRVGNYFPGYDWRLRLMSHADDRRDARLMLHFATYGVELCRHERMWAMAGGVPAWDGFETVLELLPHPVGHWAIP